MEPEGLADFEDEIITDLEPINEPFKPIEEGIEGAADQVLEDIYPDADNFLAQDDDLGDFFYYFRWIFNAIFVATPWLFWSLVLCILNLVLNILLNGWWADANVFLIFNSVYLFVQTALSWPLIYEIPLFLNQLRFFRFISVAMAWVYNVVYFVVLADFIFQLYFAPQDTYENYDIFSIFQNMFLGYNIAMNLHVIPVNTMIIVKEVFLELFPPLLNQDEGDALNSQDASAVVNPNSYIDSVKNRRLPDQQGRR